MKTKNNPKLMKMEFRVLNSDVYYESEKYLSQLTYATIFKSDKLII